jgi:protein TonB
MNYAKQQRDPSSRITGIVFVVLLHVALVYALLNGLGKTAIDVIKGPLQTKILEEVKPPEPPPPPPPPPKVAPPPPMFVPPVDINVSMQQSPNAITQTTRTASAPVGVVAPPPPKATVAPTPARINKDGCRLPEYPPAAKRAEEQGTVIVQFLVGADGKVKESKVQTSSGSQRLDEAARIALSLCKFTPATIEGKPVAEDTWTSMRYVWKLEDE